MTNRRNNFGIQCKNKKQRDQKSASSAGRALHIRNQYVLGHGAWPPRGGDLVIEICRPPIFFGFGFRYQRKKILWYRDPGCPIGIENLGTYK